jgi:hypothetical protein
VDVGLDRVRRPVQPRRDAVAVQAADHELQHLALTVGELAEQLSGRLGARVLRAREHHAEQAGREPGAAQHRGPDRGDDVLGGPLLGHEPHRAGLDGADRGRGVAVRGQHHHRRRVRLRGQQRGQIDAVHVAEVHVHDHRIGPLLHHRGEHLVRVGDGGQGGEVRLGPEHGLQPFGKDLVVIDDEHLHRRAHQLAS